MVNTGGFGTFPLTFVSRNTQPPTSVHFHLHSPVEVRTEHSAVFILVIQVPEWYRRMSVLYRRYRLADEIGLYWIHHCYNFFASKYLYTDSVQKLKNRRILRRGSVHRFRAFQQTLYSKSTIILKGIIPKTITFRIKKKTRRSYPEGLFVFCIIDFSKAIFPMLAVFFPALGVLFLGFAV